MNEDAEKWIAENCDNHNERIIAGLAMRWAYADAAKTIRATNWIANDISDYYQNRIADVIEERSK